MSNHYLTYIDEEGIRLGDDVEVQWAANGDFIISSPHHSGPPIVGTSDAAALRADGLVAPIADAIRKLNALPRGTVEPLLWQSPPDKRKDN